MLPEAGNVSPENTAHATSSVTKNDRRIDRNDTNHSGTDRHLETSDSDNAQLSSLDSVTVDSFPRNPVELESAGALVTKWTQTVS